MSDMEVLKDACFKMNLRLVFHKVVAHEKTIFEDGRLVELDISYRWVNYFPQDSFEGLNHIRVLNISGNEYDSLPPGIFSPLNNLVALKMRYMELKELPQGIFDNLQQLKELHLQSNQLHDLPHGIFDKLTQLQSLYLSGNELSMLEPNIFSKLEKLEHLHLDHNQLIELPKDIFSENCQLEFLNLSNNKLQTLKIGIFQPLRRLTNLYLSYNSLSNLHGVLGSLTILEELFLDGNQIKKVPADLWRLKFFTSINLSNNPLESEEEDLLKLPPSDIKQILKNRDRISISLVFHPDDMELFKIEEMVENLIATDEIQDVFWSTDNYLDYSKQYIPKSHLVFLLGSRKTIEAPDLINPQLSVAREHRIHIIPLKAQDISWHDFQNLAIDTTFGLEFLSDELDLFIESLYGHLREFKRQFDLFDYYHGTIDTVNWFVEQAIIDFIHSRLFKETTKKYQTEIESMIRDLQYKKIGPDEFLLSFVDLVKQQLSGEE